MRVLLPAATVVAVLLVSATTAPAGWMPRGALWTVVRSCVLAQKTVGTAFPCLEVSHPSGSRPGYAVLRAPGSPTHVIVTPIQKITGIEAPSLAHGDAGAYWRAALDSRRFVQDGAGRGVPLSSIGLAINSERTRSQDQLHIHAECVAPGVLDGVRSQAAGLGHEWRLLSRPVAGDRAFARIVGRQDLADENLFALLATLPPGHGSLANVTAFVVARDAASDDTFILLGSRSRRHSVEDVFDEDCRAAHR